MKNLQILLQTHRVREKHIEAASSYKILRQWYIMASAINPGENRSPLVRIHDDKKNVFLLYLQGRYQSLIMFA